MASTKSTSAHQQSPSPKWWSYWRLTRMHMFPAGAIHAFWPCTWGLTMAAYSVRLPPGQLISQALLYFVGSILGHSGGCIWNDICDRDFDRQVERCKDRPLASGEVSVEEATALLMAHVAAYIYLLQATGDDAMRIGSFGILIFFLYPLMKRWTYWPQAWLGIAMHWGLPVAWVSNTGSVNWTLVSTLLLGGISWTIHYDTIYACQDRRDDIKAGVKSTAVRFGKHVRTVLAFFSALFVACLAYAGALNSQGPLYFVITVLGAAAHLAWQLLMLDPESNQSCWSMFMANGDLGYIIWAGMLCDYAQRFWV
ncbi:UbiA prenyltransferase [Obba rivulosa]|uniref:4-hydroxybenzoate polyprenyltransferase, mitochondrial n=1 Tax=Obba rivulosa TaxID=1052685 RepID=A0A8E2ASR4_9APHY|nr:UbiA prenyltransferase [Obba rivulosa]